MHHGCLPTASNKHRGEPADLVCRILPDGGVWTTECPEATQNPGRPGDRSQRPSPDETVTPCLYFRPFYLSASKVVLSDLHRPNLHEGESSEFPRRRPRPGRKIPLSMATRLVCRAYRTILISFTYTVSQIGFPTAQTDKEDHGQSSSASSIHQWPRMARLNIRRKTSTIDGSGMDADQMI